MLCTVCYEIVQNQPLAEAAEIVTLLTRYLGLTATSGYHHKLSNLIFSTGCFFLTYFCTLRKHNQSKLKLTKFEVASSLLLPGLARITLNVIYKFINRCLR